jgi:ABC-type glycerol-3-phosphate transport system substrate-binding protein
MRAKRLGVAAGSVAAVALAVGVGALAAPKKTHATGTISVQAVWSGAEQKSFEAVLAGFKKANPGVKVKYTSAGDQLPTVLATAVAGGNPPDIAVLPQPGLLHDFATKGALKPITFAAGAIAANYAPVWKTLGTVNGKLYGLFFKGANKSTVWYNVSVFKNAGVKPPTTWTKFLAAAPVIRGSGVPPYSIGGADGWTLTDLFENIYLRQAGPAKYDQLSAHKIKWTDPSVKDALKMMADVIKDPSLVAGGTQGALQIDFPTSVSQVFASPPKAAMVLEGDFVEGVISSSTKAKPVSGFNVFPFPSVGNSPPAVVGGGDVVAMFRDSPAARALVKYLATPQAATIWAKRGGYSSPNKNVPASAYSDPLTRATAVALANAKTFRFDMSDLQPAAFGATVGQGEFKIFQDFLRTPANINGVASELEASAAKAYAAKK